MAFAAWTAADGCPRREAGGWRAAPPLRRLGELATPGDPADRESFLRDSCGILTIAGDLPVILVSVVPRVDDLLADAVPGLFKVDHTARLPYRHRLAEPGATGADRLCNVAAAVAAGLTDALIVDVGTATTVDVLSAGVFEGGVIAPGMAFALQQIGARAARLRPVPFAEVPLVAGADTSSAMAAGAFHAGVGGVENLVTGLQAAHGPSEIVVTGGLCRFLAAPTRLVDADWTLRGAAVLAGLV
ncbi:MAG: type III pantothenate kinase [bacterium]|nr:type III pantothenate kinase [bacterium]